MNYITPTQFIIKAIQYALYTLFISILLIIITDINYGDNTVMMSSSVGIGTRTSASYWKSVYEKDTNQVTSNPHILAARIIGEQKPVGAEEINSVLAPQNISVTSDNLNELLAISPIEIGCVTNKKDLNKQLPNVTKPRTKLIQDQPVTLFGVYCWTHIETGVQYIGSSIDLGARVRNYFKVYAESKALRPILQNIRMSGISPFSLKVWILPPHLATTANTVVLEQYFFFDLESS